MELGGFAAVVFGPSLLGFEDVDIAELGVFLLGVDSFVGVASEGVDIAVWGSARPNPIQSFACLGFGDKLKMIKTAFVNKGKRLWGRGTLRDLEATTHP